MRAQNHLRTRVFQLLTKRLILYNWFQEWDPKNKLLFGGSGSDSLEPAGWLTVINRGLSNMFIMIYVCTQTLSIPVMVNHYGSQCSGQNLLPTVLPDYLTHSSFYWSVVLCVVQIIMHMACYLLDTTQVIVNTTIFIWTSQTSVTHQMSFWEFKRLGIDLLVCIIQPISIYS